VNSVQQLLDQAQYHQQQGAIDKSMALLGEAGKLGNIYAALDFAYYKVRSDAKFALIYLQSIPNAQHPTVRYHTALITRFYVEENFSRSVISELVALAQSGHAESLLVLSCWCSEEEKVYLQIVSVMAKLSPNIYRQLVNDDRELVSTSLEPLDESSIERAIRAREAKLRSLEHEMLNEDISLVRVKNALSAFECRYLQQRFIPLLTRSMVANPADGSPLVDSIRTSDVGVILSEMADWIVRDIDTRMANISKTKTSHGEPLNLLRYQKGQEYKAHYDAFSHKQCQQTELIEEGGQRAHTVLAYLNSMSSDGETHFPKIDVKIKPEQGTIVSFKNIDENNEILKLSLHLGAPVANGEKWTLTKWIRINQTQYGILTHGN